MVQITPRHVTFIPPARATHLIGDFSDWDKKPIRLAGPISLEFPPRAYLEYAFLDASGTPFADPDNPHKAQNPWWNYPRAVVLPGFVEPAALLPSQSVNVQRHRLESKVFGRARRYYVYEPSKPAEATVYVQDGVAYYRTAKLAEVAQALCEQKRIKPLRLVFLEPEDRRVEYWLNPQYEAFVLEEVIPAVEGQYGSTPERGLWGASLGGVVSAWLALRHPNLFSKVVTQSSCLTLEPGGTDSYTGPEWLTQQYAATERLPLRLYCQTGQIEWLLAPNRRFAAMLADKGYPHAYVEHPSGHNWMTWRLGVVGALGYLFGS